MPQLEAHRQGRDILLAFDNDVGTILSKVSEYSDAITLAKAAQILRKQMLACKSPDLEKCIDNTIPPGLLQFVCMIEHGVDIKSQIRNGASKSDQAIAQLLQYN